MPTQAEKLALLEARVAGLEAEVHGGGSVDWKRSLAGKLHAMQSAMASAELVRDAAEAAARAQREATHTIEAARNRRFATWAQVLITACAVITAACAVIGAAVAVLG